MSLSRGTRSRGGEDRFYCPPAMRRHQQQQPQPQQQQQRFQSNGNKSPKSNSNASLTDAENRIKSDDAASATTTTTTASFSVFSLMSTPRTIDSTNLDRFLEHTTPSVPAQHISKTSSRGGWRWREQKSNPFFILGDLWESFKEWSAYGAGVPLVLSYSDSPVQYYVPFLSAIQLYIDPSKPEITPRRRPGEESDADSSRETSSDGSNECIQGGCNQIMRVNGHGVNGSSGNEGDITNPPGLLIFEYLERDTPYGREPLADKIGILASQFPKLTTLRSCDLTPASWVSIAWYPIYRIPVGSSLQNLEACFLTFHSLSTTPLRSMMNTRELDSPIPSSRILLPTFGLAYYKLKVSVWNNLNGVVEDNQKAVSLQKAAENWLRRLRVNHPDYNYFISHGSYMR